MNFTHLLDIYRRTLLEDVIPFWMRYALDPAGGINTCIADDGTIQSRDKWLWSQWRAVWVFSKLYNGIERRADWLHIARQIYTFAKTFGWDPRVGGWRLLLDADGRVLRGCESIYVDGFAIYGLTEFAKATGDGEAITLARQTADHVLRRLQQPDIPHFPYPIPPGSKPHGIPMMFSLVFWELGQFLNDDRYRQAAMRMSDEIFTHFHRPRYDLIVERIGLDNRDFPAPLGTAVVPGHAVEDMWFQIHIAREQGHTQRLQEAARLIRRHMEAGWDEPYGGLFLAVDAERRSPIGWDFADTKLWWPQTESLYALLLAYEVCREDWCLQWHGRVHDYCYAHYPLGERGEWRQKLDRFGQPMQCVIALPVKDPFHLPRALICLIQTLQRLIEAPATPGESMETSVRDKA